jgi:hypothetical protein
MLIGPDGDYAFITEHHPDEFQARLRNSHGEKTPRLERAFKPDHEHDEEISSVGIDVVGNLDKRKFNQWLSFLLQNQETDLFRMKGVISLAREGNRFVFQGVHMLFDGRPDRPWGASPRRNRMIFHRAQSGSYSSDAGVHAMPGLADTSEGIAQEFLPQSWEAQLDEAAVSVGWSASGSWLAAASANGDLCLFEASSGREIRRWPAHRYGANAIAWHPEEDLLASAGQDGRAVLWRAIWRMLPNE